MITRFKWLEALVGITDGLDDFAIRTLDQVIAWLRENGSPAEIGSALIDKAQAYHIGGQAKEACEALESAHQQLLRIPEMSANATADLADLIQRLKSGTTELKPWTVRHYFANTLHCQSPESDSPTKERILKSQHQLPDLDLLPNEDSLKSQCPTSSAPGESEVPAALSLETVTKVISHSEAIGEQDPAGAIKWADLALDHAKRLNDLLRGRAESIKGGALFLKGEYREAETCLQRAAVLLTTAGHRIGEAANLRRFAGLRAVQKSFAESRRMLDVALSLSRNFSEEEYGKDLAALGVLELQMGRYQEAADCLVDSLWYLDWTKSTYATTLHNLMVVAIKAPTIKTISDLTGRANIYRNRVPRSHMTRMRWNWLLALGAVRSGSCRKGVDTLAKVVAKLRRSDSGANEIAIALVDLAQAYYSQGDQGVACAKMEDAREYFCKIHGISHDAISDLDRVIHQLRAGTGAVEPWDVRQRLAISDQAHLSHGY